MNVLDTKSKELAEVLSFLSDLAEYITSTGIKVNRKDLVKDIGVMMSDDFSWFPYQNHD